VRGVRSFRRATKIPGPLSGWCSQDHDHTSSASPATAGSTVGTARALARGAERPHLRALV